MKRFIIPSLFLFALAVIVPTAAQAKHQKPLSWPTTTHTITFGFKDSKYPFAQFFQHDAIDIAAPQGSPVYAAKDGVVAVKHADGSTDYAYVSLVHKANLATTYGYLSQVVVTKGQHVKRGDLIGYSGGTPGTPGAGPFTTGPHLHFAVHLNGLPVNPVKYLRAN